MITWTPNWMDAATSDKQYDNKEEKRVIETVETPAAKKAGEGTRKNHGGKLVPVKDVETPAK